MSKQSITRRAVFTGLAAAPVAACAPHAFADDSNLDAELIALRAAHTKQQDIFFRASDVRDEADRAADREEPEFPVACTTHHQWNNTTHRMDREGIDNAVGLMFMPTERAEATCKARHKLLDKWEADCEAVKVKHDVDRLNEIAGAEFEVLSKIEKKIIKTPAKTIDGLMVKLALWHNYAATTRVLDIDEEFMFSAFEDAKRLSAVS